MTVWSWQGPSNYSVEIIWQQHQQQSDDSKQFVATCRPLICHYSWKKIVLKYITNPYNCLWMVEWETNLRKQTGSTQRSSAEVFLERVKWKFLLGRSIMLCIVRDYNKGLFLRNSLLVVMLPPLCDPNPMSPRNEESKPKHIIHFQYLCLSFC